MNRDFGMNRLNKKMWQRGDVENPFLVPDGYFEDFQSRMMKVIQGTEKRPRGRVISIKLTRWVSSVAAVLLLGFIGFQQLYLKPMHDLRAKDAMYSVFEYFAMDMDDLSMTKLIADNEVFDMEASNDQADLLEWMNVDEYSLIEAVLGDTN